MLLLLADNCCFTQLTSYKYSPTVDLVETGIIILSNYQKALKQLILRKTTMSGTIYVLYLLFVLFQEYDRSDNKIPTTCVKTGYKLNVSILVPTGYREPVPKTYIQLNITASVISEGNMFQCRTVYLNNTFYIFIYLLHQTFKIT